MNVEQTDEQYTPWLLRWQQQLKPKIQRNTRRSTSRWRRVWRFVFRHGFRAFALIFAVVMIGRNSFTPTELIKQSIHETVQGWEFDLLRWEIDSSRVKASLLFDDPTVEMSVQESTTLVRSYMDRSEQISKLEREQTKLIASEEEAEDKQSTELSNMQEELDGLRQQQQENRALVESIIQQQIGRELVDEGIEIAGKPFPPVLFSFTEPPKKMIVSRRDKIEVVHAEMIDAGIDMESIERSESTVLEEQDLSTYITNIGGLGAFPTMVIDRASLRWILSTVAHEWTHNYLTLYPLGISYGNSADLTIINETVAEIVGDEIGDRALSRYYPDLVPTPEPQNSVSPEQQDDDEETEGSEPFDFRTEMRETRIAVDQYLEEGLVDEAEYYMALRRIDFVENGYSLRVLNQAYFAFHGSYGTSAASTSVIGPNLIQLREQSSDLAAFLRLVRWFTSVEDVDEATPLPD